MSSYNPDRLDRIEALLEALSQRVDSNAKAIAANSATIAEVDRNLSEAVGRTIRTVERLAEIVEEGRVEFQEYKTRTDTNLASLNAAVERLENLFSYLLRRDGENQS